MPYAPGFLGLVVFAIMAMNFAPGAADDSGSIDLDGLPTLEAIEESVAPIESVAPMPEAAPGPSPGPTYPTWPYTIVSEDGRSGLIIEQMLVVNVWSLMVWAWPWWLSVLAGVIALWGISRIVRIIRTPQAVGEPYCRRCTYQLTGINGPQCPECGLDFQKHRPRPGRSRLRRIRGPLVVAIAPPLIVTMMILLDVPRHGVVNTWVRWDSIGLGNWANANSQFRMLREHGKRLVRIDEIDPMSQYHGRTILQTSANHQAHFRVPDSNDVIVVLSDEAIQWSFDKREIVCRFAPPSSDDGREFFFGWGEYAELVPAVRDGNRVWTDNGDRSFRWDLTSGQVFELETDEDFDKGEFMEGFRPTAEEGDLFIRAKYINGARNMADRGPLVVKNKAGRMIHRISFEPKRLGFQRGLPALILDVKLSSDGERISVLVVADGLNLQMWDLRRGELIHRVEIPTGAILEHHEWIVTEDNRFLIVKHRPAILGDVQQFILIYDLQLQRWRCKTLLPSDLIFDEIITDGRELIYRGFPFTEATQHTLKYDLSSLYTD